MQGYSSYADLVLPHSLLGSCDAAAAFCEQQAVALGAAAAAARQQLQQQPQQPQQPGLGNCNNETSELPGPDLEHLLFKVSSTDESH